MGLGLQKNGAGLVGCSPPPFWRHFLLLFLGRRGGGGTRVQLHAHAGYCFVWSFITQQMVEDWPPNVCLSWQGPASYNWVPFPIFCWIYYFLRLYIILFQTSFLIKSDFCKQTNMQLKATRSGKTNHSTTTSKQKTLTVLYYPNKCAINNSTCKFNNTDLLRSVMCSGKCCFTIRTFDFFYKKNNWKLSKIVSKKKQLLWKIKICK